MRIDEEFSPLSIVKKNLTDFNRCAYRVYKSPTEFVTVEAATALEAFRESGITNPFRILRETRFMERLVEQARFSDIEELIETGLIMEAPEAITSHKEAVPQAQQAAPVAEAATEAPVEEAQVQDAFVESSAAPQEPQATPEPEMQAEPAQEAVSAEETSELSEEDVNKLLGDDAAEITDAESQAEEESLSPDDVAALLGDDKP